MLAFYICPDPDMNCSERREYSQEELSDPKKVEELFDYCQILHAYITEDGWSFLISHYGWEKLYEINNLSGWFDAENTDDYKDYVKSAVEDAKAFS